MQFNINNKKAVKLTKKIETGCQFGTSYLFEEADFNEGEKNYIVYEEGYHDTHYKIVGFTKSFIYCVKYNVEENKVSIFESSDARSYRKKYINVYKFKIGSGRVHKFN